MADTKISALTAATVAAVANELPVNEAGTSKKVTLTQVKTLLETLGMTRTKDLTAQHSISSVTGTEVTGLTVALEVGTYMVDYYLIVRTATATVSPLLGVNFTGTAAVKGFHFQFADASGTLLAALDNLDDEGTAGLGFGMTFPTKTYTTTAPNMGATAGTGHSINVDILVRISGLLIVTVAGNLALWHSSETATATSVEIGSSLRVNRTDLG